MDSRRRTELCTYFDSHYLARGLALYSSLREHAGDLRLWVLCLDEECLRILRALALDGVVPVPLAELEESVPDLLAVKADRTLFEYYCTSTPAWLGFVLRRLHPGDVLLYMDADLFVFAGIDRVYRDLGNGSVLLTPHRFSPADKADEDKGIYNVGVLAFRNDPSATAALGWWQEACIDWCYFRVEQDRFAEQKYLDRMPELFQDIVVSSDRGLAVAPWNRMAVGAVSSESGVLVDQAPMVTYHFHGLRLHGSHLYEPPYVDNAMEAALRKQIYTPYLRALATAEATAKRFTRPSNSGGKRLPTTTPSYLLRSLVRRRVRIRF